MNISSKLAEIKKRIQHDFHTAKTSVRRTYFTAKSPYGEISVRRNFLKAKFPYGEISLRRNFLTVKFPMTKLPTAKFPSAI